MLDGSFGLITLVDAQAGPDPCARNDIVETSPWEMLVAGETGMNLRSVGGSVAPTYATEPEP